MVLTGIASNLFIRRAALRGLKLALAIVPLVILKIRVPHGSILRPILFNIFIYDFFLIDLESEISIFADDNTIFIRGNNLEEVVNIFEDDLCTIPKWLF